MRQLETALSCPRPTLRQVPPPRDKCCIFCENHWIGHWGASDARSREVPRAYTPPANVHPCPVVHEKSGAGESDWLSSLKTLILFLSPAPRLLGDLGPCLDSASRMWCVSLFREVFPCSEQCLARSRHSASICQTNKWILLPLPRWLPMAFVAFTIPLGRRGCYLAHRKRWDNRVRPAELGGDPRHSLQASAGSQRAQRPSWAQGWGQAGTSASAGQRAGWPRLGLDQCGGEGDTVWVALRVRGKQLILKIELNSVLAEFKSVAKAICDRLSPDLGLWLFLRAWKHLLHLRLLGFHGLWSWGLALLNTAQKASSRNARPAAEKGPRQWRPRKAPHSPGSHPASDSTFLRNVSGNESSGWELRVAYLRAELCVQKSTQASPVTADTCWQSCLWQPCRRRWRGCLKEQTARAQVAAALWRSPPVCTGVGFALRASRTQHMGVFAPINGPHEMTAAPGSRSASPDAYKWTFCISSPLWWIGPRVWLHSFPQPWRAI